MRRPAVIVVAVAAVVGLGLGAVLHLVADPFDDGGSGAIGATGTPPAPSPGPSSPGPSSPATAGPGSPGPTGSPSADGSETPSSAPGPSRAPAFTRLALLQTSEFLAHGWGTAARVDEFDTLPATPIVPCTTVTPDDPGVQDGRAATYASERTTAAELVVRFDDAEQAATAYQRLRTKIAACADSSDGAERVRITRSHEPATDGVTELRWWTYRPLDDGATRGVIGVVRSDDRVALLSLSSDVSDPDDTTDVDGLLNQAGRRLV